jgi:hypothetical protein
MLDGSSTINVGNDNHFLMSSEGSSLLFKDALYSSTNAENVTKMMIKA